MSTVLYRTGTGRAILAAVVVTLTIYSPGVGILAAASIAAYWAAGNRTVAYAIARTGGPFWLCARAVVVILAVAVLDDPHMTLTNPVGGTR